MPWILAAKHFYMHRDILLPPQKQSHSVEKILIVVFYYNAFWIWNDNVTFLSWFPPCAMRLLVSQIMPAIPTADELEKDFVDKWILFCTTTTVSVTYTKKLGVVYLNKKMCKLLTSHAPSNNSHDWWRYNKMWTKAK